jgi:hypothetical protein
MSLTKTVSEREILEKFKNGNVIESREERYVLERHANILGIHFGFNYKTRQGDASLSEQGRFLLRQGYLLN